MLSNSHSLDGTSYRANSNSPIRGKDLDRCCASVYCWYVRVRAEQDSAVVPVCWFERLDAYVQLPSPRESTILIEPWPSSSGPLADLIGALFRIVGFLSPNSCHEMCRRALSDVDQRPRYNVMPDTLCAEDRDSEELSWIQQQSQLEETSSDSSPRHRLLGPARRPAAGLGGARSPLLRKLVLGVCVRVGGEGAYRHSTRCQADHSWITGSLPLGHCHWITGSLPLDHCWITAKRIPWVRPRSREESRIESWGLSIIRRAEVSARLAEVPISSAMYPSMHMC